MRILYLLYNQQDSLTESTNKPKISLSWVDALLEKLVKNDSVNIALAVPVNDSKLQKIERNGITVFGLPNPIESNKFRKAWKRFSHVNDTADFNPSLKEAVNDFQPDVIHIFGSENPFGLIIKEIKTPVVIHIQGYLFVWEGKWFTGITEWEQFRYASIKDLLLMRGSYHDIYSFRKKAQTEAEIVRSCRYFMGRTDFDRRVAELLSPEGKYYHCEEFIRKDFFEKQWNCPPRDEMVCVSIIKGTSYKGTDLLFRTLSVLQKYSDRKFKFKICGISGDEEFIKIIKKKFRKEFDFSAIEFLGKLNADDLVKQLCDSNFYVHPSYIENSPNSVCEAMALGMPVIATNVGGVSDLIQDEHEGILVQEGEPYSMAGAIVGLTKNYDKARNLGSNARVRAFRRHDPDAIMGSLLDIYQNIITENGR